MLRFSSSFSSFFSFFFFFGVFEVLKCLSVLCNFLFLFSASIRSAGLLFFNRHLSLLLSFFHIFSFFSFLVVLFCPFCRLVNRHVSYIYKQRLGYRTRVNVAEAHLLADLLYTHHVSSSSSSPGTGSTALACTSRKSPGENSVMCRERSSIPRERDLLAALMSSSSSSRHSRQAFLKRQDRRLRFLLTSLGRCNGEKDRPSSLSYDYIHRKLACRRRALKQINRPRKSYLRQVQQQHMKLGVRQNKLHKFILQQNKYFF
ncbi:c2h2 type zinc-finger protein [Cystoisospora suis]|uniref:C2h2 type zinc-finger protein n=1 Tax=Cystoisospora suis TaxID=483139 RepID=A0A2C6KTY8_9APIC|nr:c2h2 type zinc-finger protein [Cystoisospora suis]